MRDRVAGGRGLPLRGPGDSIVFSSLVAQCSSSGERLSLIPGSAFALGPGPNAAGGGSRADEPVSDLRVHAAYRTRLCALRVYKVVRMRQTLLSPDETRPVNFEPDKMGETIENKGTAERPAKKNRSGYTKKAEANIAGARKPPARNFSSSSSKRSISTHNAKMVAATKGAGRSSSLSSARRSGSFLANGRRAR